MAGNLDLSQLIYNSPDLNSLTGGLWNFSGITAPQQASVAGINLNQVNQGPKVTSQDDLIKQATPQAEQLIKQGTSDAIALTQGGLDKQLAALTGFQDPTAFAEQQALLGLSGREAQQQAISGIPLSAAERESEAMQMEQLRRQAAAGGNLSSGSGLLSRQNLGAQQQASRIANRLSELETLAGIDRQIAGDISRLYEAAGGRTATLQQGQGTQLANVYLGTAPAAAQSMQSRAELEGLRKIGSANAQQAMIGQLANLAGQGFNAYHAYQGSISADPYGFGSSDPFSVSYGG